MIFDRRIAVKGKVDKIIVKHAMIYDLETVALTKRRDADLEIAELKMLKIFNGSNQNGKNWLTE